MPEILKAVFYYLYGLPFHTILEYTVCLLFIWTILNLLANKTISRILNAAIVVIITIAIVYLTISMRSVSDEREIRLIPFWSFLYGSKQASWLNAFLFFPFGLSLPYCLSDKIKHKVLATIIISESFSIIIEFIQFIFKLGLCETDDVIMNAFGAAIGTLSFLLVNHMNSKHNTGEHKNSS